MKRKNLIYLALMCTLVFSACGNSTDKTEKSITEESKTTSSNEKEEMEDTVEDEKDKVTSDSSFKLEKAEKTNELSFTEGNVLSFELVNRDDDSYEEIITTFKATNNSNSPIDYFSVDFSYKDGDGNEICTDGRFNDCQLNKEKSSFIKTYSHLDGTEKNKIQNIEITKYTYKIENITYSIDLQQQSISSWDDNKTNNAEFDKVNIIDFVTNDKGVTGVDSYQVEVQMTNNGKIPISYVSYRMGYFDNEENFLYADGRFSDNVIEPGNFTTSNSFCLDKECSKQIGAFGIYSYEYKLTEIDENGFNRYDINLQTQTVTGMMEE